jgi:hypothetical protein
MSGMKAGRQAGAETTINQPLLRYSPGLEGTKNKAPEAGFLSKEKTSL